MSKEFSSYMFLHKTTSGNTYPIEIGYRAVDSQNIPYDLDATTKACKEGCKLYSRNGGCPPFAPDFTKLQKSYPYGLIVFSRLYTRYYPPKVLRGNYYVRWVLVETLLSKLMTGIGHRGKEYFGGIFLNTGHCIGCRKCVFKEGNHHCAQPQKRTFSLESTGILVVDLVLQELGFELQWWNPKDSSYTPEYMTKVILLLNKEPFDLNQVTKFLPPAT